MDNINAFKNENNKLCNSENKKIILQSSNLQKLPLLIKSLQITELLDINNLLKNKNELNDVIEKIIENIENKDNYNIILIKKIIKDKF